MSEARFALGKKGSRKGRLVLENQRGLVWSSGHDAYVLDRFAAVKGKS